METTRKSFDVSLAKGRIGEDIVKRYLEKSGFCVYQPNTAGAHAFDIMAIKNKERCIAIDVKAKARRNKYPDTGIDGKHYETYKAFSEKHQMPFWVFFVDEHMMSIYGNEISELDKERVIEGKKYPLIWKEANGKTTRYWPLSAMLTIHTMTQEEASTLEFLSQRSHEYNPTMI